ncbi:orotidine-5'-phosphate decarboxylase [Thalassolituus hydrocarboniclasticus]|uniref:Orotidine 5'-phosphate decarboxylase n=1 Tax=Thalassolituus hydrocarboniclasticus TaxID=2742796 RepID=A0ABY6ABL0_9GAMM|nr:orotidine-5'-phosphate decarboxylase [Thalassolituus hydrocarboniclasticus]UXD87963.1 orotidine-5'-phosphate decarboxylase [Thalassolituus hydrocarboniclasticus]
MNKQSFSADNAGSIRSVSSPVVVALDYPDQTQALAMAALLNPHQCRVKVGKELFTAAGPAIVEALHKLGFEVFLDLKFHDIPNTCAKAVAAAADLGVWMVNVHASGGRRMMEAARNEIDKKTHKPLLIGVTVLTSMERADLADIGLDIEPRVQVERLAKLTENSGLDGVVCSAQEVDLIRAACGKEFLTVTPGIRPEGSEQGDQRRVLTPRQALDAGVNYMVIGRPITQAADPALACERILAGLS